MTSFCCDISDIDDKTLAFFGYHFVEENEEFKIYRDKFGEHHIVSRSRPLLFVEDINDAEYLATKRVIRLHDV